jgi:hypothetical protein
VAPREVKEFIRLPNSFHNTIDPKRCFLSAERFARAAYSLSTKFTLDSDRPGAIDNAAFLPSIVGGPTEHIVVAASPMKGDMGYVDSYVVTASLSLELYLKTLAAVSGSATRGHDLHTLFSALPNEVQERACKSFLRLLRPQTVFADIAAKLREYDSAFVWELPAVLKMSADAFVTFRYAYDTKSTSFVGFREARIALRTEILRLRPDWADLETSDAGGEEPSE